MLPSEFPAFPDRKEFDIYASMLPAKEVGGDFYDYYLIDSDHLVLTIADVSDKVVPSALFMSMSRTILKLNAETYHSPKEIMKYSNNLLCDESKDRMFVTAWLGIYEISTGTLTCVNAGHEYPIIMRNNGEYEIYKDKHSFVLGGLRDVPFKEYTLKLNIGDELFLYTDGDFIKRVIIVNNKDNLAITTKNGYVVIFPLTEINTQGRNTIGSNYKYVSQVINERYQKNFRLLVNEARVKEACRRLGDPEHYGNLTIEAISTGLGFKSRSNFAVTFKKITGLSPSDFQKMAKE